MWWETFLVICAVAFIYSAARSQEFKQKIDDIEE